MKSNDAAGGEDRPRHGEPVDSAYEPPVILWEEPYEAVLLTQLGCARESFNPDCAGSPYI